MSFNINSILQNKSTVDTWFSRGRAIKVADLPIPHLAAIIHQYEDEAYLYPRQLLNDCQTFRDNSNSLIYEFLKKHVPAWKALKNREASLKQISFNSDSAYEKYFIRREYLKKNKIKTAELNQSYARTGLTEPTVDIFKSQRDEFERLRAENARLVEVNIAVLKRVEFLEQDNARLNGLLSLKKQQLHMLEEDMKKFFLLTKASY